jgi:hypothetical protein
MMRRFLLLALVMLLAACATGPEVRTDVAQGVDLSRFRSFGFESRVAEDGDGYSSLTSQRLRAAVTRELEKRGYVLVEREPDLLVNFSTGLQDRLRVVPGPGPIAPWGFRRDPFNDWPWGWPGYWGSWDRLEPFTEGTVNIDLVDREQRRMVWEGVAVAQTADRFGRTSPEQLDASVAAIFAGFPFRAGRG